MYVMILNMFVNTQKQKKSNKFESYENLFHFQLKHKIKLLKEYPEQNNSPSQRFSNILLHTSLQHLMFKPW